MKLCSTVSLAAIVFGSLMSSAFAGAPPAVPGPIAGIGLPALVVIGGAYWVGRKFFSRSRKR
jgi:uncharacterized membrane protein